MRDGASLLRNAGGVRVGEVVEDLHGGAVLRREPVRGGVRRAGAVVPLHRPKQPLPNGHKVHIGRHSLQRLGPRLARRLVLLQRPARLAHHTFLRFNSA